MKKGINIWSFPGNWSIRECIDACVKYVFHGIELVVSAKDEINMATPDEDILAIGEYAKARGIFIPSIATGLYWQYSFTSAREDIREKAMKVAYRQIDVASLLNSESVLICPGIVGCDFTPSQVVPDAGEIEYFAGGEVVDYDVAYDRCFDCMKTLANYAEKRKVVIGIENIWNKFLLSPLEFRDFIDQIGSPYVGVHFDVGNVVLTGYPDQWIRILGERIKMVHFKDYRRAVGSIDGFVDLLAGDVDWTAVKKAFDDIGYTGWANAEMCPQYKFYTDQISMNTSLAMDRILGGK